MKKVILVLNAGSSSLKFSIFSINDKLTLEYTGQVSNILKAPEMAVYNQEKVKLATKNFNNTSYSFLLENLLSTLNEIAPDHDIVAVGHRIVHGGTNYSAPILLNHNVLDDLKTLIPLAPLHQPYNLKAIEVFFDIKPNIKQVACFDTAFHAQQSKQNKMFAIPQKYYDKGLKRYGFHGISYDYISTMLPKYLGNLASQNVVVAHLGNGSSMCGISNFKSIASTMGFSTIDGLIMGTRCGRIDAGVLLYLMQNENMTYDDLTNLLYKESGLLGISGESHDVRTIEASSNAKAKEALSAYCNDAAKECCSLGAVLNGIDALVFTAGIGENSSFIRQAICKQLQWIGIEIDNHKNNQPHSDQANPGLISSNNSKIKVVVIPTNEELSIAQYTSKLMV